MRCPLLVGREPEAVVFADALARAAAGAGSAIALLGEPGIGKTRLVEHAISLARRRGAAVTVGIATPQTRNAPLRPVAEALLALTRDRPPPPSQALQGYMPVLATLLPHWRPDGWRAPNEPIVVTGEAVLRLLRELASANGLLWVLEDLHWADEQTRAVTEFLWTHVAELPIVVLLTLRDLDDVGSLIERMQHGAVPVHRLQRLTDDEAVEMATACLSGNLDDDALALTRDAEGLPLLIEDLLSTGRPGGVHLRFADTVRARLARLNATDRLVLEAASLLGPGFDWQLLGPTTELDANLVGAALHRAAAAQLIVSTDGGFAFRHALTRDVIATDINVARRQQLCRAAAAALRRSARNDGYDTKAEAGRLLAEAGDPNAAAALFLEAGRAALTLGMVADAEAVLSRADALSDRASDASVPIALEHARCLLLTGQPLAAGGVVEGVVARVRGSDPSAAAQLDLVLVRAAIATARWEDAAVRLTSARNELVDSDELDAEIAILGVRIALGDSRPGSRVGGEHDAARAAAIARQAGRPDLECEAYEVQALCARLRDLDAAALAFGKALRLAADHDLATQRLQLLNELGTVEMLRDARVDRLAEARAEVVRVGALGLAIGVGVNLAAGHVMTGELDQGRSVATEAEAAAARLGLTPLRAAAHLMIGLSFAHAGRRSEMDRHLAMAEALGPRDADLRAGTWALGRGLLALIDEDRAAARSAFSRARQEAPDYHARILNPYEGPELLLRALSGEATLDEGQRAVDGLVRGARWSLLWTAAAHAVLRGRMGDHAGANIALSASVDAGSRYPVFLALTRRLVGEAALADRWTDPEPLLRDAEVTFSARALGRTAAACRGLLRSAGLRAPRRMRRDAGVAPALQAAGVTAREAEVLDLLADSLSNREIGERLYASPRTVEKHVAALLEKLQVPDRRALAQLSRTLSRAPR